MNPVLHRLQELLAANHNIASTAELRAIGLTDAAIRSLVRSGRLIRVCRGIYTGAPAMSREGWLAAAVAAGGPGSRLSHDHAGMRWGIDRIAADLKVPGSGIHITCPTHRRPGGDFVIVHVSPSILDDPVHIDADGLPLTSLARTIVDLGSRRSIPQLTNVLHEAAKIDLQIGDAVERELSTRPTLAAANVVTAALEHHRAGQRGTRSELEDEFAAACAEYGIPAPAFNFPTRVYYGWIELDAVWEDQRVNVELDSKLHDRERTKRGDRRRDDGTTRLGYLKRRYRWADLRQRRHATMTSLKRLLQRRGLQTRG
jgi:very-short-patch-repair endonuclease